MARLSTTLSAMDVRARRARVLERVKRTARTRAERARGLLGLHGGGYPVAFPRRERRAWSAATKLSSSRRSAL